MVNNYLVSKSMRTETGHRLMDYDGPCAHIHGHSYLWTLTFGSSELTPNGMVIDFKDLKAIMGDVIGRFDHAFLLSREDTQMVELLAAGLSAVPGEYNQSPLLSATNGDYQNAIVFDFNPTAENLAKYVYEEVVKRLKLLDLPNWVAVSKVEVWETATSQASYSC